MMEGKRGEGSGRGDDLGLLLSLESKQIREREGCLPTVSRATERGDRVNLSLVSLYGGEGKIKERER
jgi:hypothetical protein